MEILLQNIYENVINGQKQETESDVRSALDSQLSAETILNDGLISAMAEVGRRFEAGEFYVPEMLIAARAMQAGLGILKPYLVEKKFRAKGKVIMGTVKGDLHDIGKNLVSIMLEGAGFEVVDLGTDVPPDKFVAAVHENQPDLIGLSALLTTTMQNMKSIIEALVEAGVREQVKVIIGGAPVTEVYAETIGADGYAADASRAVSLAKGLV
jgi:5-methyltetrahydrofolate--homocysteine methyltransferase